MSATCASLGCGAVLMHTRGRPHEWPTLPALAPDQVCPSPDRTQGAPGSSRSRWHPRNKIVLDPGLGFGKRLDENYPLLAHLDKLHNSTSPSSSEPPAKASSATPSPSVPARPPSTLNISPAQARLHATTAANVAAIFAGSPHPPRPRRSPRRRSRRHRRPHPHRESKQDSPSASVFQDSRLETQ